MPYYILFFELHHMPVALDDLDNVENNEKPENVRGDLELAEVFSVFNTSSYLQHFFCHLVLTIFYLKQLRVLQQHAPALLPATHRCVQLSRPELSRVQ